MSNTQSRMMLHAGGEEVTIDDIRKVNTPKPTATHYPVDHVKFIDSVIRFINEGGYTVKAMKHALSNEGQRYFGLVLLENEGVDKDYQWAVGMRNSHDKKFRAEVTAGSRVFVCDNLAFSGSVKAVRKHTLHVERDMNKLIASAVGQLGTYFKQNDARYQLYKNTTLDDLDFSQIIVRAIEARVVPITKIHDVIADWRNPRHKEFGTPDAWSLFNAFTETFKKVGNSSELLTRNHVLHGIMDNFCGFNAGLEAIDR